MRTCGLGPWHFSLPRMMIRWRLRCNVSVDVARAAGLGFWCGAGILGGWSADVGRHEGEGQRLELTGTNVRLSAGSALRVVSITSLAEAAPALIGDEDVEADGEDRWEVPAVLLASLTARQHQQLLNRLQVLRQISEPDAGDGRTMLERYDEAAAETGVARRTLQRQMARLAAFGPAGLVDVRKTRDGRRSVDPRWDTICVQVLRSYRDRSNPTKQAVIDRTNQQFLGAIPDGKVPSASVAYLRLAELDKGRYTFGAAKKRRSVAKRPTGLLGRLRADRPGQYVLLDSYRMDVFAMEPVTLRWVNTELTVAMDLFDRRVTGLRLRPIAAQSPDVASVLFQTVTAQTWGWAAGSPTGPYGGVPENLVLGGPGGVLPDTIVVDHGKIYLSDHTRGVCQRLGISIQPAIPDKPTDKPALERFFRTLRQSLLETCPATRAPTSRPAARTSRVRRSTTSPSWSRSSGNGWAESTTTPPTPAWWTRWSGRWPCHRRRCSNAGSPLPAGSGFPPDRTSSMTSSRWSGAPSSTTASRSTGNATTARA